MAHIDRFIVEYLVTRHLHVLSLTGIDANAPYCNKRVEGSLLIVVEAQSTCVILEP